MRVQAATAGIRTALELEPDSAVGAVAWEEAQRVVARMKVNGPACVLIDIIMLLTSPCDTQSVPWSRGDVRSAVSGTMATLIDPHVCTASKPSNVQRARVWMCRLRAAARRRPRHGWARRWGSGLSVAASVPCRINARRNRAKVG